MPFNSKALCSEQHIYQYLPLTIIIYLDACDGIWAMQVQANDGAVFFFCHHHHRRQRSCPDVYCLHHKMIGCQSRTIERSTDNVLVYTQFHYNTKLIEINRIRWHNSDIKIKKKNRMVFRASTSRNIIAPT